jgi:hypothetical protein
MSLVACCSIFRAVMSNSYAFDPCGQITPEEGKEDFIRVFVLKM